MRGRALCGCCGASCGGIGLYLGAAGGGVAQHVTTVSFRGCRGSKRERERVTRLWW